MNSTLFKSAKLLSGEIVDIYVEGERIRQVIPTGSPSQDQGLHTSDTVDCSGTILVPAGIDVHVHSRDPGHTHKEDWSTLAAGAFRGGVVAVCDMPNTTPPTMGRAEVIEKAEIAAATELDFGIYLGVGKGNIDRLREIMSDTSLPLCGLKVYYGQSTGELMYDDLERLGDALDGVDRGVLVFHSEDQCRIDHNTERMPQTDVDPTHPERFVVHSLIRDSESAMSSTRTILDWAHKRGRSIHIAHVSTPQEVSLIEEYRQKGLHVTTEVAPHHLTFSTLDYGRMGPLIKMNPPVRPPEELEELRSLFGKGLIECFATDHAPHTLEEKQNPYGRCPSGVPAVEFFWPLLLKLGLELGLGAEGVLAMGAKNPAERFGFDDLGSIEPGKIASFAQLVEEKHIIRNSEVVCKCGWSPYEGLEVNHVVKKTWHRGRLMTKQPG